MSDASRDSNRVTTLLGVSFADGVTPIPLYADPVTHRLLTQCSNSLTSPLTTKGDIWGYNTGDARVPVGTNGQMLMADSTQALGVKWIIPTLNQIAAPTAVYDFGGQRLTNLADPTNASDAGTKQYIDLKIQGLSQKPTARTATTANITLSGAQTIDGVALVAGDLCLVKNQTTQSQNGLYVVASGAWTRDVSMDASTEFSGALILSEGGTLNAGLLFMCTNVGTVVVGTTNITFTQLATGTTYSAGTGLTLTSSTFAIDATVATLSGAQALSNKTIGNTNQVTLKSSNFTLQDFTDTTKQALFSLSGISTATTRTFTWPDASTTVVGTDVAQNLTNKTLTSPTLTGSPTAPTQAYGTSDTTLATTAFVQSALTALDSKPAVDYASTSALPSNTYSNGASGVGATLTGTANGPLIIDGVTILVGQVGRRVLVTAEAASANNGWYTITQQGTVAVSPYILTRATESDQAAEIGAGYLTSVTAPNTVTPGTANNGKVFISAAADPFTVGTTALTFSAVGGTYAAGNGLTLTGSTFSINTAVTADISTAQTFTNKINVTAVNAQTGTAYTLVATDASKEVTMNNASANTLTVPNSIFSQGQKLIVKMIGAGVTTIVAGSGTTLTDATGGDGVALSSTKPYRVVFFNSSSTADVI